MTVIFSLFNFQVYIVYNMTMTRLFLVYVTIQLRLVVAIIIHRQENEIIYALFQDSRMGSSFKLFRPTHLRISLKVT